MFLLANGLRLESRCDHSIGSAFNYPQSPDLPPCLSELGVALLSV